MAEFCSILFAVLSYSIEKNYMFQDRQTVVKFISKHCLDVGFLSIRKSGCETSKFGMRSPEVHGFHIPCGILR